MNISLSGSFQLTQFFFATALGMGGIKPNISGTLHEEVVANYKTLAKPEINTGLVGCSFISLI